MDDRQLQIFATDIEAGLRSQYPALLCTVLPYLDRSGISPIAMLILEVRDKDQRLRAMTPYVLQSEDMETGEGRGELVRHLGEILLHLTRPQS
jgi:hypothetical protein